MKRAQRFLFFACFVPFFVQAQEIRGVVTGPKGPEAGVWVIAETGELHNSPRVCKLQVRPDPLAK